MLQLKWRHAFQFAGYYAALEQGYYRDAGFDVTIRELTGETSPAQMLLAGEADYAVTGAELLLHHASGEPLVALAAIFQHSPYAFLVREDSGMTQVEDFIGRRVMLGSGAQDAELQATLRRAGLRENDYIRQQTTYDPRSLRDGATDVFNAYVTDQSFTLQEEGVRTRYIVPQRYGVDFYSDILATTTDRAQAHPERVRAFRAATLKGWEYALDYPGKVIDLILQKYNTQGLSRAHLEYEARISREMIQPLLVSIGYMNPARWEHMRAIFQEQGFIEGNPDIDGLIYDEVPTVPDWLGWASEHMPLLVAAGAVLLVLALAAIQFELRHLIRRRTMELAASEHHLREVVDTTPVAMLTLDSEGRILTINPAGLRMLAAEAPAAVVGTLLPGLVEPQHRGEYAAFLARVHAGAEESMLLQASNLRGEPLWLESHVVPLRDSTGRVTSLLSATLDVTARENMERALHVQHQRLQDLLDGINGISWDFDLRTERFTYVSANMERLLGYGRGEWQTMDDWLDTIVEQDREFARNHCVAETAAGRDHVFEYRMYTKSGDVVWVMDVVRLVRDERGQPVELAGFIIDISERKQAEQDRLSSEERYRTMFENAPEGVWLFDPGLRTLQVNQRLCTLLGVTPDAMAGRTLGEFICDTSREACASRQRILARPGRQEFELDLKHHDGHGIPTLFSTIELPGTAGEPCTRLAFVTDLSQQKLAEQTLRRVQKMEAVGQLTGGIAHDFNNILGIIQGNLELLELDLSPEAAVHDRVVSLQRVTRRAVNLTQQLLGFSRTRTEPAAACNLNDVIRQMNLLAERSLPASIEVRYRLAPDLWAARLDPGEFQDALLNLELNARDAMEEGGTLTIATTNLSQRHARRDAYGELAAGEYVCVSVADSGVGMTAAVLEHVFEPFFTTKENGKGTGLGLSMVFGFVQRSGGYIDVRSEPRAGTVFTLYLPRATEDAPEEAGTVPASRAPATHGREETILVVDDEVALVEVAQRHLEQQGYRVLVASDGKQALRVLADHPEVALLFTDVVMPGGVDGVELGARAVQLRPQLKVLLTSGYTDIRQTRRAPPATTILRKPYGLRDMLDAVRALLDPAVQDGNGTSE